MTAAEGSKPFPDCDASCEVGAVFGIYFVFLACWNDVYTSVLYINANSKKTLTVAIYSMIGKYDINWGNVAAGTLIAMLPAILLFGFMKEIFVENIAGAVKE